MIRHSFEIIFENVQTNKCIKEEFDSFGKTFIHAWKEVNEYALKKLESFNKYVVLKNIEYTNMR